jgi:hypothetical protein
LLAVAEKTRACSLVLVLVVTTEEAVSTTLVGIVSSEQAALVLGLAVAKERASTSASTEQTATSGLVLLSAEE